MNSLSAWLFGPANTNLKLVLAVLVDIVILVLIGRAIRATWRALRAGSTSTTEWIAKAPTTNMRILNGIVLANIYVLVMLAGIVLGRPMHFDATMTVGGFVLVQLGLDLAQFGWKRSTFKTEAMGLTRESAEPAPPSPAAEIVAATGEAPVVPPPVVEAEATIVPLVRRRDD